MTSTSFAWCDGRVVPADQAVVSAYDRTLLYGLGAFETVRLHGGRPFLFDRHLQRLQRSLAALELPLPDAVARLTDGIVELAAADGTPSALCRVTVTAGPEDGEPVSGGGRVLAMLRAVAPPPQPGSVRVGVATIPHDTHSPLSGLKSTSYLVHYLLREAAERAGRLDDLMLDGADNVTEATVSSVFVVRDGRLWTPPLASGILPGVTRGLVLELARQLSLPIDEQPLPRSALASVDECFLTGAGKIQVSVDELDGRPLPAQRPVTRQLRGALVSAIAAACDVPEQQIEF